MRSTYPSDISREQFEIICHILESSKKSTRPKEIDIYKIFCAILCHIREGCRWRSIPHDFPNWEICCYHYNGRRKSSDESESVLDRVLRELVENERGINGRDPKTTMLIVDSKSVKNTDATETKGYDAGKTSGVKLHIGVDILGLPQCL